MVSIGKYWLRFAFLFYNLRICIVAAPTTRAFYSSYLALVGLLFWRRIPGKILLALPFVFRIWLEFQLTVTRSGVLDLTLKGNTPAHWMAGAWLFVQVHLLEIIIYLWLIVGLFRLKHEPTRQAAPQGFVPHPIIPRRRR